MACGPETTNELHRIWRIKMIKDSWGSNDVEVPVVLCIECTNTVNSYFCWKREIFRIAV